MNAPFRASPDRGYALLLVLCFTGIGLLVLSSILTWSASNASLTRRKTEFYNAIAAAEAATEKVLAHVARDFQLSGPELVDNNRVTYQDLIPKAAENAYWAEFEFSDLSGQDNRISLDKTQSWSYRELLTPYRGLSGYASTYRLYSGVLESKATQRGVAIQQDFQVASIPLYQFALFYGVDLELSPDFDWTLNGLVHANGSIFLTPEQRTLTFASHVTASGQIVHSKNPLDPSTHVSGTVTYKGEHDSRIKTLQLPIGDDRSPAAFHGLIEPPPPGESISSLMGQQRFYNQAELIILVSNQTAVAKSGAYNNFSVTIPWSQISSDKSKGPVEDLVEETKKKANDLLGKDEDDDKSGFISTNMTFFNKRENKNVIGCELDIEAFLDKYDYLTSVLGRPVKILYIADFRASGSVNQAGLRVINGEQMPPQGLTLATPNPLYILGHYNSAPSERGTSQTQKSLPAALAADALTVLSEGWKDQNGKANVNARQAEPTTINAAILAGIVPTTGAYYSGGAENMIRLLEDWEGVTLTFNGSIVVLFHSQTATGPWGATADVYKPPQRRWSFDNNFKDPQKLPPGTPQARALFRSAWSTRTPVAL